VPDFPTFRNAISESSHLPRRRFRDNISGLFYRKPLQLHNQSGTAQLDVSDWAYLPLMANRWEYRCGITVV
jgi:hypothetical protein